MSFLSFSFSLETMQYTGADDVIQEVEEEDAAAPSPSA